MRPAAWRTRPGQGSTGECRSEGTDTRKYQHHLGLRDAASFFSLGKQPGANTGPGSIGRGGSHVAAAEKKTSAATSAGMQLLHKGRVALPRQRQPREARRSLCYLKQEANVPPVEDLPGQRRLRGAVIVVIHLRLEGGLRHAEEGRARRQRGDGEVDRGETEKGPSSGQTRGSQASRRGKAEQTEEGQARRQRREGRAARGGPVEQSECSTAPAVVWAVCLRWMPAVTGTQHSHRREPNGF